MVSGTTGAVSVDVVVQSKAWSVLAPTKERVAALAQRAVGAALARAGVPLREGAELSVALADDEAVRQLNAQWRGLDKPTNVLSFPAADPDELADAPHIGDIVLAFETVAREAQDDNKTLADHTTHLIIHGTLHLLGFDHETDAEAEEMEALEIAALADLGIADPYADLDLL
ncbi:putative rRNA maturation factor [Pseudochelatococcus lubricantis]|uniref:Endoribonuclease YbeY n=1 Tax=Pseudochelatococcus lubricantis TaxID=1538102 RepID=A0ABX0UVN9_9HYPH|nr:rRNA maturation RNase YbeY [Pseudochelatococcus lubricantis]NIJ57008.1 putative rRNA maturation factor [Pseudochelatococcus lubricantis]